MARCPYAPHRLVLSADGNCQRCGGDLRLFAAIHWLPEQLFNDARRLLEAGETQAAGSVAARAIALRNDFPEALELMAVIASHKGTGEQGLDVNPPEDGTVVVSNSQPTVEAEVLLENREHP